MIGADLAPLLQSGVSLIVGTRDSNLVPESARALGARVETGGRDVTVFLPVATCAQSIANLAANGRIAVTFVRIGDHYAVQAKGRVVEVRAATGDEHELIDRYRGELIQALGFVGMPPRQTARFAHWPAHAVRFVVEALYEQTPGPGAGGALARAAASEMPT